MESTRFEFFNISMAETSGLLEIVEFYNSDLYLEDNLGLKELDKSNRLYIERYDCFHEEFKLPNCFNRNFSNQDQSLLDFTLSFL